MVPAGGRCSGLTLAQIAGRNDTRPLSSGAKYGCRGSYDMFYRRRGVHPWLRRHDTV
jgi:hypothetical protein